MKTKSVDKIFLGLVITLLVVGILVFVSASLGILPKNEAKFYGVLFNQLVLGFGGGIIVLLITSRINYKFWRKYSFYIFLAALLISALVFLPGILPFLIFLGLSAVVLLKQPDIKSFILIVLASLGMFFISGVRLRNILILGLVVVSILGFMIFQKPYLLDRVETFLDPSRDPLGSSYQLQQSLIAIGSGGVFGRGFGQSIQKFSYLPEPQGDSIFAVLGEEFGFVGAFGTIFLYLLFALRGFRIANNSPDAFSRLLVSGIVILIIAQSFMHIASITGVFPLTGVPLPFMSLGGTSLMVYLT